MTDVNKSSGFWPDIESENTAKKLLRYGVGAALFTSIVTALIATWAMGANQTAFGFINSSAFFDVAIFLALAFGIYKGIRAAAVAGLLLFIAEKAYQIQLTGKLQGAWMAVIIIYCYVQAIRATYALHRIRGQTKVA